MKMAMRNSKERSEYGCTVSFLAASGDCLTLARTGLPLKALAALCDLALLIDPTFRVVAYSTPETILADMTGGRLYGSRRRGTPEVIALGRIGRRHLCHESLLGSKES